MTTPYDPIMTELETQMAAFDKLLAAPGEPNPWVVLPVCEDAMRQLSLLYETGRQAAQLMPGAPTCDRLLASIAEALLGVVVTWARCKSMIEQTPGAERPN